MTTTWIIDELLSENGYKSGFPTLAEAARELGHDVLLTKYVPFSNGDTFGSHYDYKLNGKKVSSSILYSLDAEKRQATIVHGTIEFCKLFEKHVGRNYTPGLYFNENVKRWSKFAPHIGEDLLNSDFDILPFGTFVQRCRRFKPDEIVPEMATFIKPESGLKEFTGQVVHASTLEDDLKKLSPYHELDPTTLVVGAHVKDIKAEFRYVICDRQVVTGSEYRWDNVLDVRRDTHPNCDAMALKVAQADWQADSVYVCDVALLPDNTARVVELNAFSSSGLYACDTLKIVEAVSRAAEKEHRGDVD